MLMLKENHQLSSYTYVLNDYLYSFFSFSNLLINYTIVIKGRWLAAATIHHCQPTSTFGITAFEKAHPVVTEYNNDCGLVLQVIASPDMIKKLQYHNLMRSKSFHHIPAHKVESKILKYCTARYLSSP